MANTYLSFTTGSAGNRAKWTWSGWVKKTDLTANGTLFFAGGSNSDYSKILLQSSGTIYISEVGGSSTIWEVQTNRKFRDPSAYYHMVFVYDSAQSTASNRLKIYINGVQETSFATASYPAQNRGAMWLAGGTNHRIGRDYISQYFGGIISDVNFSEGYAYGPEIFGETDTDTGEWRIKDNPSFSLGTYGFTILKNGNTITDQSTNSNNFTVGGGALTNTKDCPSNVFATLNPLQKLGNSNVTLNYGNTAYKTTSSAWGNITSTLGFSSGKFYVEGKILGLNSSTGYGGMGIIDSTRAGITTGNESFTSTGNTAGIALDYRSGQSAIKSAGDTVSSNIGNFSNGDIIGMAIDMDNKALYIHKGGTYYQIGGTTGVPTSGSSKTGAITIPAGVEICMIVMSGYSAAADFCYNFGNGYFITTAVSSAGTNASGNGIFEYDVPSGYTALSTKGLNL